MAATVQSILESIAKHRLLAAADHKLLSDRWYKPGRAGVDDPDQFGHWLSANGYLSPFAVRLLGSGRGALLRLNQYQIADQLDAGPFTGAFLAHDPLGRQVVIDILTANIAADPQGLRSFQELAEKATTFRHNHVNQTLDFGQVHGRHYLVREFHDGETLASVLARHKRVGAETGARVFAQVFAALDALQERQLPTGDLTPACILLAVTSKKVRARSVKLLNTGVPRSLFDPRAFVDDSLAGLSLARSWRPDPPARPEADLYRLGCSLYQSLTGQLPSSPGAYVPVQQLAPETPEMLVQTIESLLDTASSQRPGAAARAAKALRVFLATEESAPASRAEVYVSPVATVHAKLPVDDADDLEEREKDNEPKSHARSERQPAAGVDGKLRELWEEIRPAERDWFFLGAGASAVIVLALLFTLVTGFGFVNLICLLTGGALSFLVERWLRLDEKSSA